MRRERYYKFSVEYFVTVEADCFWSETAIAALMRGAATAGASFAEMRRGITVSWDNPLPIEETDDTFDGPPRQE